MIMDTGASVSIVMDCNKINSVIQIPEEVLTTINGNTPVKCAGYATVTLQDTEGELFDFTFEARCAPGAKLPGAGILSCPAILDSCKDCKMCLSRKQGFITLPDKQGRLRSVAMQVTEGGLPELKIFNKQKVCLISAEAKVLHDTLGHLSHCRIIHAINEGWITGVDAKRVSPELKELTSECYPCKLGQNRNRTHGRRDSRRTMQPLELIHLDVCFGPPRGSVVCEVVDHASALVIADDATRFNFVYGVDGNVRERTVKGQSLRNALIELKRDLAKIHDCRRQSGINIVLHIRGVHTDGGSDIAAVFKEFCTENGINFTTSDVNHPWQNGLAERSVQALKYIAKKLLLASGVPSEFWVYAMKHAAMIRNVIGIKVHGKVICPFAELLGRSVSIEDLHPFGCRAFMSRTQLSQSLKAIKDKTRLPEWKLNRLPVWFLGYAEVCLTPKKFVVVVPNTVLQRATNMKGHLKFTSELIFDHNGYARNIDAQKASLNADFNNPQGTLNRSDLNEWLDGVESSEFDDIGSSDFELDCDVNLDGGPHVHPVAEEIVKQREPKGQPSLSTEPNLLGKDKGVDVLLSAEPSLSEGAEGVDAIEPFQERNVVPPRWLEHAESFQNSGWAPTGYAIDSETKEGGIDEGNDPTAGTDQPAEGVEELINHFSKSGRVSEQDLRLHHMFLVAKYEVDDPLIPFDIRGESTPVAHVVYTTAVAHMEDYGKVVDESTVDFTPSREKEFNGLLEQTLEAVDMKSGANICGTKWVDKVKPDGTLKSRLVVQGFTQVWLKDYHDTFSAVATLTTFRLLINLAAILGWVVYTIDVSQAYTQGELHEEIFIRAPATHPLPKGKVYRLRRPLYGTKQAGRCWYLHVTKTLRQMGLTQASKDSCLFIQRTKSGAPELLISVLVDDLMIIAEEETMVKQFHVRFSKVYKVSQFEQIKVYNGIEITRKSKHIYVLSQHYAISQFLAKCAVQDVNPCDSPLLPSDTFVLGEGGEACNHSEKELFQSILGSLNWFNIASRPDLAVACSLAGRVASQPTKKQFKQLTRIVGYLKRHSAKELTYDGSKCKGVVRLYGFSDSDWAGQRMSKDPSDRCGRKSTSGYISYSCGPTNWKSKLQNIPATSSAQAEFIAMYEAAKDLLFQTLLLKEIGIHIVRVPLFCDNTTTIKQMMETMSSKSNKHMEIRYAWLQHYAHREGYIQPFNIASGDNVADLLTKILPLCKVKREGLSNHFNILCEQIFSGDIQGYIDARMKEGMVRGDKLNTYEHYLKSVEQNEIQPFRSNSTSQG